ncbi:MAG TPA: hypothetical protein VE981_09845 [Planctomycetota bacterium]|nr:hypothetical protein [Planctomycetota bacterium]
MKSLIAAVLAVLAMPLAAQAQSDALWEWRPSGRLDVVQVVDPGPEVIHEVSLGFRLPILGGDNNNKTGDKWSDVYRPVGFGFFAQYSALFRVSPVVSVGPYISVSTDVFVGDLVTADTTAGNAGLIDVDPISETRLVFGARVREQWGAFVFDQNLGIGPIFYGSGTGTQNFLVTDDEVEIIKASANLTFEIGFRVAAAVSRHVDLGLGFVYELNGRPDVGKDITDPTFEFKAQSNLVISFVINLNF